LKPKAQKFRLNTSVARIEARGHDLQLTLNGPGTDALTASHIFVATGGTPNTDDLGLEKVGE
jgi:pyruvate/2-oxoglutarate dehydrogenase complex dihydrolipoamide dehydrogenase (E3) component